MILVINKATLFSDILTEWDALRLKVNVIFYEHILVTVHILRIFEGHAWVMYFW